MPGLEEKAIIELLSCEKKITEAPRKNMTLKNRSFRNDMKLSSIDDKYKFVVFMRINEDFQDDFSVGLIFISAEGKSFMIYRCNGPHGECTDDFLKGETHYGFHEHSIVPDTMSEMVAEITTAYGTFQDAIFHFVKKCNITDAVSYFPFLKDQERLQYELGI